MYLDVQKLDSHHIYTDFQDSSKSKNPIYTTKANRQNTMQLPLILNVLIMTHHCYPMSTT